MEKYWETHPRPVAAPPTTTPNANSTSRSVSSLTGFDKYRQGLVSRREEGWVAELGRYLGDLPQDAMPEMDVVKY